MEVPSTAPTARSADETATAVRFAAVIDLLLAASYIDGMVQQTEREFLHRYLESVLAMHSH